MSVVGIDLGTVNSVIAVARNRGVDVVSTRRQAHTMSKKIY
jgi:molecular chaperone DnaK (HSP70)